MFLTQHGAEIALSMQYQLSFKPASSTHQRPMTTTHLIELIEKSGGAC